MNEEINIGNRVSIASIIGRLYVANIKADAFCYGFLRKVFNDLRNISEFIPFDTSNKSIQEILGDDCLRGTCVWVPSDKETRKKLKREYYNLNAETREVLSGVLRKHIKGIKDKVCQVKIVI